MNIIIFILVLLIVVIVHEYGHFFAAKSMGMRVKEFAFGFPPKLFSWKRGETTYSLNAIPLGGYVAIDGENEGNGTNDNRKFGSKSRLAQLWVLFAGPMMNIILAFVLITASYIGINKVNPNTIPPLVILDVMKGSPAEIAGIKSGDIVSSVYVDGDIDPSYNPSIELFQESIQNSKDKKIILEIEKNKEIKIVEIQPEKIDGDYKIGVSLGVLESKTLPFGQAVVAGAIDTAKMTKGTILGFGTLFKNIFSGISVKDSLMGPIGIAGQVGVVADFGFRYLLLFTAMISISIGILNLLPLPALDGGRVLVTIIESARRKSFPSSILQKINLFGFLALFALLIFITILDIIKLVK